jgi:ketosteroid isomerase-like protein
VINHPSHIAFIRRYLAAIEQGATGDALAAFYTPDVVQEEFPNRLVPTGARRDLSAILDGAARGQKVLQSQRYEIVSAVSSGDHLALELIWTASLAVPLGSVPVGGQMRAHFAQFIDFRDGKIAAQRTYDCFDPF